LNCRKAEYMRLLLVRHGQTASNIGRALDTAAPGAVLTDLGLSQAARLAERLACEDLDVIAASPLTRAQQTAQPVAEERDLAIMTLDGLCEIGAGDLEMQTSDEAIESYIGVATAWATGSLDTVMPGGTSGQEFLGRFDEAVRAMEEAGTYALAVSHGAAIRTWVAARCSGVDAATYARSRLANTGAALVEGSTDAGWRLAGWIEELVDDLPATGLSDAGGSSH
jgi:probable phosphoglycerate mutase